MSLWCRPWLWSRHAPAAPPPPAQSPYTRDVRDFGADPSGRSDSTTAFIAAAAAGPFVVSDGIYSLAAGALIIDAYCAIGAAAKIVGTATVVFQTRGSARPSLTFSARA